VPGIAGEKDRNTFFWGDPGIYDQSFKMVTKKLKKFGKGFAGGQGRK
jgi:hypothetical protein